jgi:hypothetical protein
MPIDNIRVLLKDTGCPYGYEASMASIALNCTSCK